MKSIFYFFTFIKNLFSRDKKLKIEGDIKGIKFGFEDVEDEEEVDVDVELEDDEEIEETIPQPRQLPERRVDPQPTTTNTNNDIDYTLVIPPVVEDNTQDNHIDYTLVVPPIAEPRENKPKNSISADSSTEELIEFLLQRLSEEKQTNNSTPKVKTKTR